MYMLHSPGQDKGLRRQTWKALEALVAGYSFFFSGEIHK